MSAGHPFIPPPEFDPRETDALRELTAQNHRNAVGQTRGLGRVVHAITSVVGWPIRRAARLRRRSGD